MGDGILGKSTVFRRGLSPPAAQAAGGLSESGLKREKVRDTQAKVHTDAERRITGITMR
jgi:hypothetical protein